MSCETYGCNGRHYPVGMITNKAGETLLERLTAERDEDVWLAEERPGVESTIGFVRCQACNPPKPPETPKVSQPQVKIDEADEPGSLYPEERKWWDR